jgi:hypothetical protein
VTTVYVAGTAGIISEPLGAELLVYDRDTHVAHALGAPAARVWTACQAGRTADELVVDTGLDYEVVLVALRELSSAGLVTGAAADVSEPAVEPSGQVMSRRAALAGVAVVGLSAPLVLSLPIASARGASSGSAPTVDSLIPTTGSTVGGTSVDVSGTNFVSGDTTVTIGGTTIPAAAVTVDSPASLTFTTPAHAPGSVAVSVSTSAGTSGDVPGGFTYT